MNKTTLALLSAVCLAGVTAPALAAGPQGMRGAHQQASGGDMIETFDTNGDGQLTQAEIDGFRASRLAAFDADNDGELSLEEYQALWLDAYRERMVDEFQRHDDDGNSRVTAAEFNEPFANMVARMDRNEDGVLTRDELQRRHRDANHRRGDRGPRGNDRAPQ